MSPAIRTFLTFATILFLISALYFFISGASMLYGFVCVGAFLFALATAIQLTPTPPKVCPKCGSKWDLN